MMQKPSRLFYPHSIRITRVNRYFVNTSEVFSCKFSWRFRPPVDLKPLKILKPKLDRMITSWAPLTLPIFVEIGRMGSAPHIAEM